MQRVIKVCCSITNKEWNAGICVPIVVNLRLIGSHGNFEVFCSESLSSYNLQMSDCL